MIKYFGRTHVNKWVGGKTWNRLVKGFVVL